MNRVALWIIALTISSGQITHGMYSRSVRALSRPTGQTISRYSPTRTTTSAGVQKRTLYTPERLKGLYTPLTPQARAVSPVHGAAKYTSGSLQRMYATESDAPAIQLVKELFYQLGNQFKPTSNKSKPAYSLDATMLGLVMGALEVNQLDNPAVRHNIIAQWRAEHKNITDGARLSVDKINNLLNLIESTYEEDKNAGRSILLAFLYAKADPSSDHDMMHYLSSINQYMPVFKDPNLLKTKQESLAQKDTTMLDTLKTTAQSIAAYFTGKKDVYTPKDYAALKQTIASIAAEDDIEAVEHALSESFEQTISTILNEKQASSTYPPQVVQSSYGYQNKISRPDCVETALRDFLNILLYDQKAQSFDLSLLPKITVLNDAFKAFYTTYNTTDTVNTSKAGQAFMNLVSDVPRVSYAMDNYELRARDTENNLLILMNHFLGLNAQNLQELGQLLSDEHRTITLSKQIVEESAWHKEKIIITIHNIESKKSQNIEFHFSNGHGELKVPERKNQSAQQRLLNPYTLVRKYNTSQKAQSLFSIQPTANFSWQTTVRPSLYYSIDTEEDIGGEKKWEILQHILKTNAHNKEAADYAYTLYTKLPPLNQLQLFDQMMHSGIAKTSEKFNTVHTLLNPQSDEDKISVINTIFKYANDNPDAIEYAYTLFNQLHISKQIHNMLGNILKYGIWENNKDFEQFCFKYFDTTISTADLFQVLTPDFVKKIYAKLPSDTEKKNLLPNILSAMSYYSEHNADLVAITNELLALGSDINAQSKKSQLTPLLSAIKCNDTRLIETLIDHGVDVNQVKQVNIRSISSYASDHTLPSEQTPLNIAILHGAEEALEALLKQGANPNLSNAFNNQEATLTPLILATRKVYRGDKMILALLNAEADPNIGITVQGKLITPLFAAIENTNAKAVDILLQNGANIHTVDQDGNNALDRAIEKRSRPDRSFGSRGVEVRKGEWISKPYSEHLEQIIQTLTNAGLKAHAISQQHAEE